MDGVLGLVEELADLSRMRLLIVGSDVEQGGDDGLRQREALVEDGGQEPVGEGVVRTGGGPGPERSVVEGDRVVCPDVAWWWVTGSRTPW
jgi:hypothetical protein